MTAFAWNEGNIAAALARNTFDGHLCCLPNCTWTGDEVDLLVVSRDLRVIDVEIKISRADLKADMRKDKWWHHCEYATRVTVGPPRPRLRREWPRKVWKHYYAMPAEIWRDDLRDAIPAVSGVLLVTRVPVGGGSGRHVFRVTCARRSKPCRDASRLTAEHVMQLARLTSLRLWDVYKREAA
jgi:hypothetical protein